MSKRPGFAYDGSKIVIVPTISFCGPPAKKTKPDTPTPRPIPPPPSQSVLKVTNDLQKSAKKVVRSKSAENSVSAIPKPPEKCTPVTSKKAENVKTNSDSVKNDNQGEKKEQPSSSWASNFLSSIGQSYRKPIKINLSTKKIPKVKPSPIPKVDSLRKEDGKESKNNEAQSGTSVCQTNLKVLVNSDTEKEFCPVNTKALKQLKLPITNSTGTVEQNLKNVPKMTNSVNRKTYPAINANKPNVLPENTFSKKDPERVKSSSKSSSSKSSGKRKHITLNDSDGDKYSSKKKLHKPEINNENKTKTYTKSTQKEVKKIIELKNKQEKIREKSDKRDKTYSLQKEKAEKIYKPEPKSSCSTHESKTKRKEVKTTTRDKTMRKDTSEPKTKKPYKDDPKKESYIKSKIDKRKSPSRTLEFLEQMKKVSEVLCKTKDSEQKKLVKSVVSSSKPQTITSNYNKNVNSPIEIKTPEEIRKSRITDLREKLSHKSLSELFAKKRNQRSYSQKRDNLKITITNTPDDEEMRSSEKQSEPSNNNTKEYKTIKVVINIRYEQPSSSEETEKKPKPSIKTELDESNPNMDLSFLDDINIDEIINSLDDCSNSQISKSNVELCIISDDSNSSDATLTLEPSTNHISSEEISPTHQQIVDNHNISWRIAHIKEEPIEVEPDGCLEKEKEGMKSKIDDTKEEWERQNQSKTSPNDSAQLNCLSRVEIKTELLDILENNVALEKPKVAETKTDNKQEERSQPKQPEASSIDSSQLKNCPQVEIKAEPLDIEYENLCNDPVNLAQKDDIPDELEAQLAAITNDTDSINENNQALNILSSNEHNALPLAVSETVPDLNVNSAREDNVDKYDTIFPTKKETSTVAANSSSGVVKNTKDTHPENVVDPRLRKPEKFFNKDEIAVVKKSDTDLSNACILKENISECSSQAKIDADVSPRRQLPVSNCNFSNSQSKAVQYDQNSDKNCHKTQDRNCNPDLVSKEIKPLKLDENTNMKIDSDNTDAIVKSKIISPAKKQSTDKLEKILTTLNKTITETKSQILKCQNEESNNNAKRTPVTSPKNDLKKKENKKIVFSPPTLKGVDEVRGKKLEQCMKNLQDDFQVNSVIHKGHYSILYKCKDSFGRNFAAKVIKKPHKRRVFGVVKERMLKEIQKDIPKSNLNFVFLYTGFPVDMRWCFLMEYCAKNLNEVLEENDRPFDIEQLQDLSRQLVSAITVLRNNNIVHTDIKPTHIMMTANNKRLKLCGFDRAGIANSHVLFATIGTVNYRAPEIILGYSAGFEIDVWSAGLVMYEMATKLMLFPGTYNNDILWKQMCTLGPIPNQVIVNSLFANEHFVQAGFLRKYEDGRLKTGPKPLHKIHKSPRLRETIINSYHGYWAGERTRTRNEDLNKLHCFHELLTEMLNVDPNSRIPIEFVYASQFIHSFH